MHSEGNLFSQLVFFIWVAVALWGARRWPPAKAGAWLLLLPLMFLPEQVYFKLPGLPEFEKSRIAVLWVFVGVLLFHRDRLRSVRLDTSIKVVIAALLGGRVLTVLTNAEPISSSVSYIPGHVPYDAVHGVVIALFDYVLPFLLGAAMFTGPRDLRVLFRVLVSAGLIYSVLQLFELRMSPQLHTWVYGFFQHSFQQTIRGGGFRPTVFMEHGLAVALFTLLALIASAVLFKLKVRIFRIPAGWILGYLWLLLLLSKSVAAFLYSLLVVPIVLWVAPKTQLRFAMLLGLLVLAYPSARGAGIIPVADIQEWVAKEYGEEKVESVMTRFVNEERLLERANERWLFGWGWYGRAYVTHSIRDGDWVITTGNFGRVGFYSKYLLLILPLFQLRRRLKAIRSKSDQRLLAGLSMMVAISAFDLLPNGNFSYLVFVFAGALSASPLGVPREQARHHKRRQSGRAEDAP